MPGAAPKQPAVAVGAPEPHTWFAPLLNFDADGGPDIQVLPGVTIRPMSQVEKDSLVTPDHLGFNMGRMLLDRLPKIAGSFRTDWVIAVDGVWPSANPQDFLDTLESIVQATRAVRLQKSRMTNWPYIAQLSKVTGKIDSTWTNALSPEEAAWARAIHKPYRLDPAERPALVAFASKLDEVGGARGSRSLRVALERFDTVERFGPEENRIIDAVIAMEAILLKGIKDELKFRFALRGARLVGKTPNERSDLFKVLKDAYDRRSDIVHGSGSTSTAPTADEISDLARRVIGEFVLTIGPQGHDALIQSLDDGAVRG
jgi:hypothetical protein